MAAWKGVSMQQRDAAWAPQAMLFVRMTTPRPSGTRGKCLSPRAHTYSAKEALINSLFAFILEFLCNARNEATRIASYLRSLMTQQCIKILIKANSMNESVLP